MVKGIFCHDLPIYIDINGNYGCTTLTDSVFKRYLVLVDELVVATRLYHLDCTLEEAHQERITLKNIRFLDIPNINRPQYFITRVPKVKRMMEDELKTCDLIIIRGGTIAKIGAGLAIKYHKPYLLECAGSEWGSYWYYGLFGKLIAPFAEFQVKRIAKKAAFVSYVTERWLQTQYPTNGITAAISDVVIKSVSDEVLKERLAKNAAYDKTKGWVIGTAAGLMTRLKGQQFVIEAMSRLRNKIDIRYELAGTGDPSYLLTVAKRFGVEDRVIIKGELTHEEILKWMDSLDAYIQPSMQEGLPRALMEAMSRACPCMGSNAGGIPELLESDAIFRRGSINELTKLLETFFSSDWKKHSMFNHNRAKAFQLNVLDSRRNKFYEEYRDYVLNGAKE